MMRSLPHIADTFAVFAFFLLLAAMVCVMLWSGTFHYRCKDDATEEWVDEDTLCYPEPPSIPGSLCNVLQVPRRKSRRTFHSPRLSF